LPRFQNQNLTGTVTTNGALAIAIWDFWEDAGLQYNTNFYDYIRYRHIRAFPYDPYLSDWFKEVFKQGFYEDDLSRSMPFSIEFLEQIFLDVPVYIAWWSGGAPGLALPYLERGDIFIGITGSDAARRLEFVFLAFHEMAHALGLGESLADLFAEEFLGLPYATAESGLNNVSSVLGGAVISSNQIRGRFYYSSTFDRVLLRKLEAQGRADEFWFAAFHSNAEYARLWDRYMSEYMTFNEMQNARAVSRTMFHNPNPRLSNEFREMFGFGINEVERGLLIYWHIMMDENLDEERVAAKARFNELIAQLSYFATTQRLNPAQAVLDHFISNHHFRQHFHHGGIS